LRAFAEAQETWNGGSQQESNDQENNHELDYREKFLNVFVPRHSCKKDAHLDGCRYWTLVPSFSAARSYQISA
jgi:hypothetical protein